MLHTRTRIASFWQGAAWAARYIFAVYIYLSLLRLTCKKFGAYSNNFPVLFRSLVLNLGQMDYYMAHRTALLLQTDDLFPCQTPSLSFILMLSTVWIPLTADRAHGTRMALSLAKENDKWHKTKSLHDTLHELALAVRSDSMWYIIIFIMRVRGGP